MLKGAEHRDWHLSRWIDLRFINPFHLWLINDIYESHHLKLIPISPEHRAWLLPDGRLIGSLSYWSNLCSLADWMHLLWQFVEVFPLTWAAAAGGPVTVLQSCCEFSLFVSPLGLFTATFGEEDADKELPSFLQIEGEAVCCCRSLGEICVLVATLFSLCLCRLRLCARKKMMLSVIKTLLSMTFLRRLLISLFCTEVDLFLVEGKL